MLQKRSGIRRRFGLGPGGISGVSLWGQSAHHNKNSGSVGGVWVGAVPNNRHLRRGQSQITDIRKVFEDKL